MVSVVPRTIHPRARGPSSRVYSPTRSTGTRDFSPIWRASVGSPIGLATLVVVVLGLILLVVFVLGLLSVVLVVLGLTALVLLVLRLPTLVFLVLGGSKPFYSNNLMYIRWDHVH